MTMKKGSVFYEHDVIVMLADNGISYDTSIKTNLGKVLKRYRTLYSGKVIDFDFELSTVKKLTKNMWLVPELIVVVCDAPSPQKDKAPKYKPNHKILVRFETCKDFYEISCVSRHEARTRLQAEYAKEHIMYVEAYDYETEELIFECLGFDERPFMDAIKQYYTVV